MSDRLLHLAASPRIEVRRLWRTWLTPGLSTRIGWIECAVITLLAIGIGWSVSPADPLLASAPFPWLWLAPTLIALRYGAISGLASGVALLAAGTALALGADGPMPSATPQAAGGLVLALLCGEAAARWRLHLARLAELNDYLSERVERVTKRLDLLQRSHDRLEQELVTRPATLRDALARWRTQMIEHSVHQGGKRRGVEPLPGASAFLNFLAQQCQIEVGALYSVDDPARTDETPVLALAAKLGAPAPLAADNPLLLHALANRCLAHVQHDGAPETPGAVHLAIAPLRASDGRLFGVLTIDRLPFFALNEDNLQLVAVLGGVYADTVADGPGTHAVQSVLRAAPESFTEELARLLRIEREYRIDSQIVALLFRDAERSGAARQLIGDSRRAPDVAWQVAGSSVPAAFVNLLPIAGDATARGYIARIEAEVQGRLDTTFAELGIETHVIALSSGGAVDRLAWLLYGSLLEAGR